MCHYTSLFIFSQISPSLQPTVHLLLVPSSLQIIPTFCFHSTYSLSPQSLGSLSMLLMANYSWKYTHTVSTYDRKHNIYYYKSSLIWWLYIDLRHSFAYRFYYFILYSLVRFPCLYVYHNFYPFVCFWDLDWLHSLNSVPVKHGCGSASVVCWLTILQVYTQERYSWILQYSPVSFLRSLYTDIHSGWTSFTTTSMNKGSSPPHSQQHWPGSWWHWWHTFKEGMFSCFGSKPGGCVMR